MIIEEKYNAALHALNLLLTRARFMAYKEEPYKKIAEFLDYIEMLPRLIALEEDKTNEFRNYLVDISGSYPECKYILNKFDEEFNQSNW